MSIKPSLCARVMEGSGSGKLLGTAYPLDRTRFLTAGHVVGVREIVDLAWGDTKETHRARVRVLWIRNQDLQAGGLDAAVLALEEWLVPPSGGVLDCGVALLRQHPFPTRGWETRGYPIAADVPGDGWTNLDSANGDAMGTDAGTDRILLNVRSACWTRFQKGFSGAPVFIGPYIAGIVSDPVKYYQGRKMLAVPTWRLLEDASFAEAVGPSRTEVTEWRAGIRRMLESESLRDAISEPRRRSRVLSDHYASWHEAADDLDELCDTLIANDLVDLICGLNVLHEHYRVGRGADPELAAGLFDLLCALVPRLVSGDVLLEDHVYMIPSSELSAAELFVAREDHRDMNFRLVDGEAQPQGDSALHSRREFRLDPGAEFEFDDLCKRMWRWLKSDRVPADFADLVVGLNKELDHLAGRDVQPMHFYLVLQSPLNDRSRELAKRIQGAGLHLRVVALDGAAASSEERYLGVLRDMIHRHLTGKEWPER